MECQVIQVQSFGEFNEKVINSPLKSVLTVFIADWCPSSKELVIQLRKELEAQRKRLAVHGSNDQLHVPIYVVDIEKEELKEVVKQFSPMTLPYVYLFDDGKFIAQFGGMDYFAIQKIALKAFEKLA